MNLAALKSITRRPPVILASLLIVAVLAFAGVNRLVNRFGEQEKALARHLYEHGLQAQSSGNPEAALGDFRAALGYSHDNFQYQLSLARALRDTGRTAEAESYLISLWERSPQEGAVNLALGRLFAREKHFDKAIQYYHNAIYGFWPSEADTRRRDAQFELIEFLVQQKAYPQAQAELITMASALPADSSLHLRVANLFARAQDYDHALAQCQEVLRTDHGNQTALYGAAQAAFRLGRYRTAQGYLQSALRADPQNADARQLLETATQVLQSDPFAPRISDAERNRRVRSAFLRAGDRLEACAKSQGIDLSPQSPSTGLPSLEAQWLELKPKVTRLGSSNDGLLDQLMNLVYEIEQQTQSVCGPAEGLDRALLLLSQGPAGAER
ncbi:MAG TPA: tetratricopeptide repeat protein [Terriglobales bacterium]|jgi:tetratricopeptide (TPR) repeat protein|nr:tetratricopeptide repeat protein [Terriglobales bacterium]